MKNIKDVVSSLNTLLAKTELSKFYDLRVKLKGGNRWSGGLLQATFGGDTELAGYSFHKGGRTELQFNVGFEEGKYFRYGLAFSLEPNRNLIDPVSVLTPKILRFNESVTLFPALRSLAMWSRKKLGSSSDRQVRPIKKTEIVSGNFIFIGERVAVPASGVTSKILSRAAHVMESLLPVYQYVEGGVGAAPYKVARLCWNNDNWERPSGRQGKIAKENTFEAEHGFGHEEWLFDLTRLIDGYKFGFIQALNHSHAKYEGNSLNLLLYTIDNKTKSRYWVASIMDVKVLTVEEAWEAKKTIEQNGWLKEMRQQVRALGFKGSTLTTGKSTELINLKYRPEHLRLFAEPIQFPAEDLGGFYYGTLQSLPESQSGLIGSPEECTQVIERNINKLKSKRVAYVGATDIDLVHKRWQKDLKLSLKKAIPGADVYIEAEMFGHLIDAIVEYRGKRIFIELKTRSVVRHAIREALSQLMEYSFWPPLQPRADALLIVAAGIADTQDEEYLANLRNHFGIPVYYRRYRDSGIEGIGELVDSIAKIGGRAPASSSPIRSRGTTDRGYSL